MGTHPEKVSRTIMAAGCRVQVAEYSQRIGLDESDEGGGKRDAPKVAHMNPFGRRPLVALECGARPVQRRRVQRAVRVQREEHDRVTLDRLDRHPLGGARGDGAVRGQVELGIGVGEHGFAPLFHGGQVHEHSGDALAACFRARVDGVVEVVPVRLVLFAVVVVQDLQPLLVLHWDHRHLCAHIMPPVSVHWRPLEFITY